MLLSQYFWATLLLPVKHRVSSGLQLFSCGQGVVSCFGLVHQLIASFLLRICSVLSASAAQDHDGQHVADQRAAHEDHQHSQEPVQT